MGMLSSVMARWKAKADAMLVLQRRASDLSGALIATTKGLTGNYRIDF
jgi:ABC-type protease/lipase transport system fused ATPase/permease subunit